MYNRQEDRETTNKIAQARLFRIRFFNGMKRITSSTILKVITTIIIIGELYYTYRKVYMDSVFHDRFFNGLCFGCFLFVFSVLDAYLISRLGSPIVETVTHTASFNQIGLYNRSHQTPQIINKKEKDGVWTYEYFANGLPLSDFVDRKADIEASLNKVIIDIKQGKDRSRIIVKAISGDNQLPEKIVWDDSLICSDNGVLVAGISEFGLYTIDFDITPHLSINGQSGCGKSVLLSCLLHQIKKQDPDSEIYLADFKSLMDFSKYERAQYNCITDRVNFKSILKDLCNEMDRREELLSAEYCNDVSEYNKKHIDAPLHRIIRDELIKLFKILDQDYSERDPYTSADLLDFPYVNGGLFSDESIIIPQITEDIRNLLLAKASDDFNWSEISPTIFGAVFESTLNLETRRSGGMHYTSIENIHKVIDPLFLDGLRSELDEIKELKQLSAIKKRVIEYQEKLAGLKFLDPAAGSGNFLTETYISLRKLENEALQFAYGNQMSLVNPIKVSISQFYGIEINDFAVSVAQTALWIAESQMKKQTEYIFNINIEYLPLKSFSNIQEGNALRLDWNSIVPNNKLDYIMGNPPFVGARKMKKEQKDDMRIIFSGWKNYGNLDYVSCWYKKASDYMHNTRIRAALVSTNSITQGEQVSILWKPLLKDLYINFAYKTFRWDSEANIKAHVHCVIIGFSFVNNLDKFIVESDRRIKVKNINPYLIDYENVYIENSNKPLFTVKEIRFGSMPNDNGALSNFTREDKDIICKQYPAAACLFKRLIGAEEFLHNKERYCLWLSNIDPSNYLKIPPVLKAIEDCKTHRENSNRDATKKLALTPHLFGEIRQPDSNYIVIPEVSSENRDYIPIDFISPDVIANNRVFTIPNADLFDFAVLMSSIHNSWIRAVSGRLEMRYNYSAKVVYNNFPWPSPSIEQRKRIIETGQSILTARKKYKDSDLSDLYGKHMYLFPELLKAHQQNDIAVMAAYGINSQSPEYKSESSRVVMLMEMYKKHVKQ